LIGPVPARDLDTLWRRFQALTRARIGLGRVGHSLPTARLLEFQLAHAEARDAVLASADFDALAAALGPCATLRVRSLAADRAQYLRRPDLGRRLHPETRAALPTGPFDAVFVVADGLSARAVQTHAVPLLQALLPRLDSWNLAPVVFAEQARVALGDEIGGALSAQFAVVLIGERPGLSVPDSLGVYLTHEPRVGRRDSERNCISNIHADGLATQAAADKLEWLMTRARQLRLTGVALKEDAPADPAQLTRPGDA
jgi:ethanolamine ammonia-lyase small subunit